MAIEIKGRRINLNSVPPIEGRVFIVGTGSGSVFVDGLDNSKPWFPLQDKDVFKIVEGTYSGLTFNNLKPSSGIVKITNYNGVVQATGLVMGGDIYDGVLYDFHNTANGGAKYGLVISNTTFSGDKVVIDADVVGGFKNITIKGINHIDNFDKCWTLYSKDLPYMNGTGKIALENFTVEDCSFIYNADKYGNAIDFGGFIEQSTNQDKGFCKNIIFRRIDFIGGDFNITMNNCQNFLIEDIKIIDCWKNAINHPRIIDIGGNGIMQRITGDHNYGPLVKLVAFNRTSTGVQETSIIRNITGKNSRKYSITEVHSAQADSAVWPGVTVRSKVKVLGVTAIDTGTMTYFDGSPFVGGVPPYYTSTALDVYGDSTDITVRNCTSINPYIYSGQPLTLINGPAAVQTNNVVVVDNSLTKVSKITFIPAADSSLKGQGIADLNLLEDFNKKTRSNPPTIGAVEAL